MEQRRRGYGGVALAWNSNLSQYVQPLPDGIHHILPVLFELGNTKLCIVMVYLPGRGNHSETEFQQHLDILLEIWNKYEASHTMVILGDFNASIFENRHSRDKVFYNWVCQLQLHPSASYPRSPTYVHPSGKSQSTIDYILLTKLLLPMYIFTMA